MKSIHIWRSALRENVEGADDKPGVNITMLRALSVLGETQSFSRTADCLCITQSAVSHAVRALEAAAGVPLVNRSRRNITLTAAGEHAVSLARSALRDIQKIGTLSKTAVKGEVTLALITSASVKLAPPLLKLTAERYPDLDISLLMGTDQEVARWVSEGIADMGLSFHAGDCRKRPILECEFFAISSDRSGLPDGSVSIGEIAALPVIMSSGGCGPIVEALFEGASITPNVALTANDMTALFALTAAGHGVSIVPALSFPSKEEAGIARHALTPSLRLPLWLLMTESKVENQTVTTVESLLKESASNLAIAGGQVGIYAV